MGTSNFSKNHENFYHFENPFNQTTSWFGVTLAVFQLVSLQRAAPGFLFRDGQKHLSEGGQLKGVDQKRKNRENTVSCHSRRLSTKANQTNMVSMHFFAARQQHAYHTCIFILRTTQLKSIKHPSLIYMYMCIYIYYYILIYYTVKTQFS